MNHEPLRYGLHEAFVHIRIWIRQRIKRILQTELVKQINDLAAPFIERLGTRKYTEVPGVYIQALNPVPAKNYFKYPDIYIAGGLILFHRAYINIYIEQYNHNLKEYDINTIPGTMDQYVMASMTQNSHFVHPVITKPACPDEWFFFLALI